MAENYTEVTLRTPHFDDRGQLYRPGHRKVPARVAQLWGYASEPQSEGGAPSTPPPGDPQPGGAGGVLPEDFPGRAALVAAGLGTTEAVRAKSREELITLKGIGEKTADEIAAALA